MGKNANLKKKHRAKRRREINEGWPYFTSGRFLGEVQRLIRDAGIDLESSVGCTKVLHEIAREVGLSLTPISVEATVYNPIFAEHIRKHGLNPSDEDMHRLGEAGGRFVTLGARNKKNDEENWHGYVAALLKAPGKPTTLIDIAIGQATRLEHGIVCDRPMVFGTPSGFIRGTHVAVGFSAGSNGKVCYVYRAFPDDKGFENTVDWKRSYGAKAHDKIEFGDMPEKTKDVVSLEAPPSE